MNPHKANDVPQSDDLSLTKTTEEDESQDIAVLEEQMAGKLVHKSQQHS